MSAMCGPACDLRMVHVLGITRLGSVPLVNKGASSGQRIPGDNHAAMDAPA